MGRTIVTAELLLSSTTLPAQSHNHTCTTQPYAPRRLHGDAANPLTSLQMPQLTNRYPNNYSRPIVDS
jgi:hypothetical protein